VITFGTPTRESPPVGLCSHPNGDRCSSPTSSFRDSPRFHWPPTTSPKLDRKQPRLAEADRRCKSCDVQQVVQKSAGTGSRRKRRTSRRHLNRPLSCARKALSKTGAEEVQYQLSSSSRFYNAIVPIATDHFSNTTMSMTPRHTICLWHLSA
jgi:hypothetical protein